MEGTSPRNTESLGRVGDAKALRPRGAPLVTNDILAIPALNGRSASLSDRKMPAARSGSDTLGRLDSLGLRRSLNR